MIETKTLYKSQPQHNNIILSIILYSSGIAEMVNRLPLDNFNPSPIIIDFSSCTLVMQNIIYLIKWIEQASHVRHLPSIECDNGSIHPTGIVAEEIDGQVGYLLHLPQTTHWNGLQHCCFKLSCGVESTKGSLLERQHTEKKISSHCLDCFQGLHNYHLYNREGRVSYSSIYTLA